jgi:glycosyltransferase involved in cell wall biosynthesis
MTIYGVLLIVVGVMQEKFIIQNPKLSILMPVYNEERTVEKIIKLIDAVDLAKIGVSRELVIVDDGSKDKTRDILKAIVPKYQYIKYIEHVKNKGKGGAIKTAIKNATGNILIVQDADLEYDPQDYFRCILPILRGKAKVVYGSRRLKKTNKRHSTFSFFIGGIGLTWFFNILFFQWITDEPTCYKTFRADVIKRIKINGNRFDWEPEVTAKIAKMGIRIREVPITYYPRTEKEGKKIKWKDGFEGLWTLIKYRFVN